MATCEVYLKDLSQKLYRFQKENVLCDTVLIADDCHVWAHSIVLAAVSPYVHKHFLRITRNKAKYRFSLKLPGCEAESVRAMLHFLYTGSLVLPANFQNPETFAGILLVCEKLGINVTTLNGATVTFVEAEPYENHLESNGNSPDLNESVVDASYDLDSGDKELASHCPGMKTLLDVGKENKKASSLTEKISEILKEEEITSQDNCEVVDIKLEMGVYEQDLNLSVDFMPIQKTDEEMGVCADSSNSKCESTVYGVILPVSTAIGETEAQSNSASERRIAESRVRSRKASIKVASKILRNTLQKRKKQAKVGFLMAPVLETPLADCASADGSAGDGIRKRLRKYEKGTVTCPMCNKTFKWHSDFKKHMELFQEHSALTCKDCGKVLTCKRQLLAHEKLHLGRRLHVCPTCGKVYRYRSGLSLHLFEHTGQFPYLCDLCGAGFKNFFSMEQHKKRRHSTYRPFVCQECGKGFIRKVLLLRHATLHSGEKLNICPKCGMSFSFSGNLSRHLRSHDGVRPHCCKTCGRSFNRIDHLQNHVLTHSRMKAESVTFTCAECGKAFKSLWMLKRHALLHSASNLHSCGVCAKRFTGAMRLKQHMITHEEKQFICPVCKRTFSYERFLTTHMKKIHHESLATVVVSSPH